MIVGAHSIIYSKSPEADRGFLRDVLGLPPSEVAVHPSKKNDVHELYLMCDDVEDFMTAMKTQGIACGAVQNQGWGLLTQVTLPGGGKLGVYQPRHARPKPVSGSASARRRPRAKPRARPRARRAARRRG